MAGWLAGARSGLAYLQVPMMPGCIASTVSCFVQFRYARQEAVRWVWRSEAYRLYDAGGRGIQALLAQ